MKTLNQTEIQEVNGGIIDEAWEAALELGKSVGGFLHDIFCGDH